MWQHYCLEFEPPVGKEKVKCIIVVTKLLASRCDRAPCAQSAVRETLHVQPYRPCGGKEENIYLVPGIFIVPSRRGKKKLPFRPAEEKNYIPSRPAGEKTIYRPFPSRKKIFTVPSRPSNILIPHFTGPFSFFFPAKLGKSVPSRPVTILIVIALVIINGY